MKNIKFYNWAAYYFGGYASAKMVVFSYLYSFYENKKNCSKSINDISKELYMSRSTIIRAINELKQYKLIEKKLSYNGNSYKINEKRINEIFSENIIRE